MNKVSASKRLLLLTRDRLKQAQDKENGKEWMFWLSVYVDALDEYIIATERKPRKC